jgi:hypothetical protein
MLEPPHARNHESTIPPPITCSPLASPAASSCPAPSDRFPCLASQVSALVPPSPLDVCARMHSLHHTYPTPTSSSPTPPSSSHLGPCCVPPPPVAIRRTTVMATVRMRENGQFELYCTNFLQYIHSLALVCAYRYFLNHYFCAYIYLSHCYHFRRPAFHSQRCQRASSIGPSSHRGQHLFLAGTAHVNPCPKLALFNDPPCAAKDAGGFKCSSLTPPIPSPNFESIW